MQKTTSATVFFDWLRFSVDVTIDRNELLPPHDIFSLSGEILTPLKNYNRCIGLMAGRVDWHTERPEQRMLVTLTGDDLLRVRRAGYSDTMLAVWINAFEDINVTRLDIAIDTRNVQVTPPMFYRAWLAGKIETSARKATRVQGKTNAGTDDGYTVYIGSRQSEQFLRIYDKNAEQKARGAQLDNPDEKWTRIELELKGRKAKAALRAIAGSDIKVGGEILGQFVRWQQSTVWGDLTSGNVQPDMSVGRKETDHEVWLRTVVFPNFKRALAAGNPEAIKLVQTWIHQES